MLLEIFKVKEGGEIDGGKEMDKEVVVLDDSLTLLFSFCNISFSQAI